MHYYQDALGFVVTDRSGSTTHLTTGVDHHCVIVQPGERDGRAAVGFEVAGSLTDVQRDLKKLGLDVELRSDPSARDPRRPYGTGTGTGNGNGDADPPLPGS